MMKFYDTNGRHWDLSRLDEVQGMLCGVEFRPDSWTIVRVLHGKAVSFRYEPASSTDAKTTVEIELLYRNKPYEGLLGADDFEEKRRRGEPEDGRMKGVTLESLVAYIETLAVTPLDNIRPPSQ